MAAGGRALGRRGRGRPSWRLYAVRNRQRRYYRNIEMQYAKAQRWEMLKAGLAATQVEEITDHPLLTLLRQGNPMLTGINTRRLLQIHLDLVGESFWVLERNKLRMPIGVWPIPPPGCWSCQPSKFLPTVSSSGAGTALFPKLKS
jgi:hypothetical protein